MSPKLATSFWERNGLEEKDREGCLAAIESLYPGCRVEELKDQGYCSYTIAVSLQHTSLPITGSGRPVSPDRQEESAVIVQIRPKQHALDLNIARTANCTYGSLAPAVRALDLPLPNSLHAYQLSMLCGSPYARCQHLMRSLDPDASARQVILIQSFATLIARSWASPSQQKDYSRRMRADSPVDGLDSTLRQCTGRVGSKIIQKLQKLAQYLPDLDLQRKASSVFHRLASLQNFPVVLNHGDLIPSNILIDPGTWEIQGLVDWAEAEILPFGTCLYGLELLLGYVDTSDPERPEFIYYDQAQELRSLFWQRLEEEVPETRSWREEISLTRELGVLLWYGYAWDEGRIDRVVNEVDDKEEVECLRKFLNVPLT